MTWAKIRFRWFYPWQSFSALTLSITVSSSQPPIKKGKQKEKESKKYIETCPNSLCFCFFFSAVDTERETEGEREQKVYR